MTISKNVNAESYIINGTVGQYQPVKLYASTSNTVAVCAAEADVVVGVTLLDSSAVNSTNRPAPVAKSGTVPMTVGAGGVTKGDKVGIDSAVFTRIQTYNASNNNTVIGIAQETGTVGQTVPVDLKLQVKTA